MKSYEKLMERLARLTERVAEDHLALSAEQRKDRDMLRELKADRKDHERWLRDHEVRLRSHYRGISDLRDRFR